MAPRGKKAKQVQITLRRSLIGRPMKHRAIVHSLGLRRMHQTVTRPDSPQLRGMIHKVSHLLEVEEAK